MLQSMTLNSYIFKKHSLDLAGSNEKERESEIERRSPRGLGELQGGLGVDIIKYIVYFTTQVHSLLLVHLFLGNSLLSFATVLYQGPHSCLSTSAPPPSPSQSPSDLLLTVTRARKPLALPLPPFLEPDPEYCLKPLQN